MARSRTDTTMAWTLSSKYTSVSRNLSRNRGAGFGNEFFAYTVKISKGTENVLPHVAMYCHILNYLKFGMLIHFFVERTGEKMCYIVFLLVQLISTVLWFKLTF